jgi:hypothetical protein
MALRLYRAKRMAGQREETIFSVIDPERSLLSLALTLGTVP